MEPEDKECWGAAGQPVELNKVLIEKMRSQPRPAEGERISYVEIWQREPLCQCQREGRAWLGRGSVERALWLSKGEMHSERRQKLDHTGPHDLGTIAASWAKDGHVLSCHLKGSSSARVLYQDQSILKGLFRNL